MFAGAEILAPGERSEVAMVLWIGVDDTDSLRGMCTTFLVAELVRDLTRDFDLVGYPRLVRLNPNIPWKTRGNAAVCLRIGSGRGEPMTVGELGGRPIQMFPRGRCDEPPARVLDRVSRLVERWSRIDDETTNPGFTISPTAARAWLYWRAVRRIVTMDEAVAAASTSAIVRGYKNGRGIIGALAATSWRPRDRKGDRSRVCERYGHPVSVDVQQLRLRQRARGDRPALAVSDPLRDSRRRAGRAA